MFIEKYVNSTYLDLIYESYDEEYLSSLDENNFVKVYNLLKNNGFYFIDDVILNYLELFEMDEKYIAKALLKVKELLGNNYVIQMGKDMTLIDKVMDLAISFIEEDI